MNINTLVNLWTEIRNEENNLLKFMRSLNLSQDHKILDIGCGFGDKLKLLRSHGFNVTGIDVNQEIIAANLKVGMSCMTVADFNQMTDMYDVMLMSHVIEHFQPDALLAFMDNYLDRLKIGGHLIITTPLSSPYFYDDFDHVKPYHPTGINMVFSANEAQVQYYSRNKLEVVDLWFRKGPFKLIFKRGLYLKPQKKTPASLNLFLAIIFRLSFGFVGRTDGWMGLYRKTSGGNRGQ
jgi:SAM-dependent methyltransferase